MKHLKKFEIINRDQVINDDYKAGDYVYISPMYTAGTYKYTPGKLLDDPDPMFHVMFLNGYILYATKHMIFRKLYPMEIEKFELEKASNKYNI